MSNTSFYDLVASITERGRELIARRRGQSDPAQNVASMIDLCEALLSERGEASGLAQAAEILDLYQTLGEAEKLTLFTALLEKFGPNRQKLQEVVRRWLEDPAHADAGDLHYFSEAARQELFRRLNRAPGGTHALVHMRADLLALLAKHKYLAPVDRDFAHLLAVWFNRGFLVLRSIDWSTPAIVLEKIIRYEAVHQIHDFSDLRLRIDAPDRRCYGFFHPSLSDEPLIFVEVALTEKIPSAIGPLLMVEREFVRPEKARTAVFYSISTCQKGLAGVSFGNFLIKQVVEELRRDLPNLTTFVTLSPVPGFIQWLQSAEDLPVNADQRSALQALQELDWPDKTEETERLQKILEPLAAHYFLKAKRADGRPRDSVARFHLGNGARLEQIHWLADKSPKGLRDGAGFMVNYLYDLDDIEKNHEAFVKTGDVTASSSVKKMLKAEPKIRALVGVAPPPRG
ncbi:malonyl-CoA decarboxylase [Beijerinckia mobilis]|uniref:malonyl-CoA decarboxylase n=1 Tax=Beijerinckia mobilis TaxID=231434 RepID=UPI000556AF0B|nr:malonyl-CoA decarboxylase [Beijerinckia mobilis]